jgi:16S rRNA processing protein RimM
MSSGRPDPVSSLPPGSDEVAPPSEPAFLAVGHVLRPHGVRGEIRVEIHTHYPERFAVYKNLYIGPRYVPFTLESYRFHQNKVLLKLAGVNDRNTAETLRDQWVCIAVEDAVPLAEGEVYLHQMLSLRVLTADGEDLGEVAEIIETGANPVYVVRGRLGEILIPDIPEVILNIDLNARQLTVRLIEGLR